MENSLTTVREGLWLTGSSENTWNGIFCFLTVVVVSQQTSGYACEITEVWRRPVDCITSISWLWYSSVFVEHTAIGGKFKKAYIALYLIVAWKSTVISKWKVRKNSSINFVKQNRMISILFCLVKNKGNNRLTSCLRSLEYNCNLIWNCVFPTPDLNLSHYFKLQKWHKESRKAILWVYTVLMDLTWTFMWEI